MERIDPTERLLRETPVPLLMEGVHREQLKQRLLAHAQSAQPRRKEMLKFADRFSMLKVAATLAAAMILISTGWAAEKMYQKFFTKVSVTLERSPTREWKIPDGRNLFTSEWIGTAVDPDDPKSVETAKRHHEEMKQLLAQKKYDFTKTSEFMGRKEYVYKFTFADGSHTNMNFSMPLDNVVSWEDYQQKQEQKEKQRQEQINKALAAGRFRLIDSDVMLIHICREVATNQKYRIQRIALPDRKEKALYREIALYRPFDVGAAEEDNDDAPDKLAGPPGCGPRREMGTLKPGNDTVIPVRGGSRRRLQDHFQLRRRKAAREAGSEVAAQRRVRQSRPAATGPAPLLQSLCPTGGRHQ